jgi:hypothetical protein
MRRELVSKRLDRPSDLPEMQKPILEYTKKGGDSRMTPEQEQAKDNLFRLTTNRQQRYKNMMNDLNIELLDTEPSENAKDIIRHEEQRRN